MIATATKRPIALSRLRAVPLRRVRGRFDSGATTEDNRRHWANADALSADAAASAGVRRTLRNRARYEVANNSYARGIVLTLANDAIGTGPRLQMLTDDAETNQTIEREFAAWARAVDLPGKLRTMRQARAQDGEAFAIQVSNDKLRSPVKLDLKLVEAEQVATPAVKLNDLAVDGIEFDPFGNPVAYHVLKAHPGSGTGTALEYDRVPADAVIHWFRTDRPGQRRGLPDILPSLPLFAQLRRYTLAVIAAAETAADFAAVLFTDAPANGEAQALEPMDVVELEKRMATVLPDGWRLGQVEAQQPATTYGEFKREILNEIARCLNMPYNIAACNSSGYNYASGRLDHQTYFKSIRVEQAHCETVVLDRILEAWMAEAVKVFGLGDVGEFPHQWFWDGHEHVDPAKEASAQATRLASNTTTLAAEYARQGKDWETELRQRAKEVALAKELGLTTAQTAPAAPTSPADRPDVTEDEDEQEERESRAA
jgi:lambda family phage portal protein